MTKKQAELLFKVSYLPNIPKNNKAALRQAWNNYTDSLCRNGEITVRQHETWTQPIFISG